MKKTISIILSILMILSFASCAKNSDTKSDTSNNSVASETDSLSGKETEKNSSSNILVAYFSCTGTTAQIASYISDSVGGTLAEISPKKPYTSDDLDYTDSAARTTLEQSDESTRVDFNFEVSDISSYDTIYIGYPIWFGKAPKIIYSFLEAYDFSGKTIIPFCTSASSDISDSVELIKPLSPNAKWQEGKRFSNEDTMSDVVEWLK